jgi:plastocyanin
MVTGMALIVSVTASPVLADETVEIGEGTPTDITTWGFTPPEVRISAGESITWMNTGSLAHSATEPSGAFDTSLLDPGDSSTIRLSTPGTYAYNCSPHPWMKGTVIVAAAAGAPAAAPAAAPPAAQAQPTATPFRFLTPTPVVPRTTTTTTSPTATPAPRAGGVPIELALPLLAGGASALSGGVYLLRRGRRNRPNDVA